MCRSTPDDLSSLKETLAILSEPAVRAELAEAEKSILDGDVVTGAAAIRAPSSQHRAISGAPVEQR